MKFSQFIKMCIYMDLMEFCLFLFISILHQLTSAAWEKMTILYFVVKRELFWICELFSTWCEAVVSEVSFKAGICVRNTVNEAGNTPWRSPSECAMCTHSHAHWPSRANFRVDTPNTNVSVWVLRGNQRTQREPTLTQHVLHYYNLYKLLKKKHTRRR